MADLERVINGLEICEQDEKLCFTETECPYQSIFPRCCITLIHDALELLKEQQSAYERGKRDGVSQYLRDREEDEEYEY